MRLDLPDCTVSGAALPAAFFSSELGGLLARKGLIAAPRGWQHVAASLRRLRGEAGPVGVSEHVLGPLAPTLGYAPPAASEPVVTREGPEDGGLLLRADDGGHLRCWALSLGASLEAARRAGRAYRQSAVRSAQRILLTSRERLGLVTNGEELRLLVCDAERQDGCIHIDLTAWRDRPSAPDSFRLLRALAAPAGIKALPDILHAARLNQAQVTASLRHQARAAITGFLSGLLDNPANLNRRPPPETLWAQSLILIDRLLFLLKLESPGPAHGARFTASRIWRETLSPGSALAPLVRRVLDHGAHSGGMLEHGLRTAFAVCRSGLTCAEISIPVLGGRLFSADATALLDALAWGERSVAVLLDRMLWTTPNGRERERIQYSSLGVEELGHVYESLLELRPRLVDIPDSSAVQRFSLHPGLGRKTSGSFYTPQSFVKFLVRETLSPLIAERSPDADPDPAAILSIKVLDPAAGSGHFLVEACRFLGDALHAACLRCDAKRAFRSRIDALPCPDHLLGAYLPSRAPEGLGVGISEIHAQAICRRLVAVNCLYGIDANPLAIELAKLALWLETHADGLPLTFLDHRMLPGDSLTGPFLAQLATLPVTNGPLDPLLAQAVTTRLAEARLAAVAQVAALEASLGRDQADLLRKLAIKERMDALLMPWRELARAWAGAVMLGACWADDEWLGLARQVAQTGAWPLRLTPQQAQLTATGASALPWDATFPEVFARERSGFDAVLCNPPWDIIQANGQEFRAELEARVPGPRPDAEVRTALRQYRDRFSRTHRAVARLYSHQSDGSPARLDTFRVFAERNLKLAGQEGTIGMVVPSAFHSNQGAAGTRRLYFDQTRIEWYLSFENRRRLFDIHASFRFALLVARRPGPTTVLRCGFYLHELSEAGQPGRTVCYDRSLIEATSGPALALLELRSERNLAIAKRIFLNHSNLLDWGASRGLRLGRDMNITDDAHRVTPIGGLKGRARLVLHEGKTIHQFTDRWGSGPRFGVAPSAIRDKPSWRQAARFYRLAFRKIARSTDERTAIAAVLPPGSLCNDTAPVERTPQQRPNAVALILCGILNSFPFDWALRQKTAATVNLFILESCPICQLAPEAERFVAHAALRLSCRHRLYAPLWLEQMGAAWHEDTPPLTWPAIATQAAAWRLRAAMDAIIARSYGLDRDDYQSVLSCFSHRSFAAAPELCLAAFDQLTDRGLDAFCRAQDPYWSIPLPVALPEPA